MTGLEILFCARTTATRFRRHAAKEHKKPDPKPRRQTNLCMLAYCFGCLRVRARCVCVCVCVCVPVLILCVYVYAYG